ncbi:hypothetical protein CKA32_003951 [Geitlerinema sp. FC II]|nr:hypothetical protein CKA32_003951 [Geitlerinema sp. FC II]
MSAFDWTRHLIMQPCQPYMEILQFQERAVEREVEVMVLNLTLAKLKR